MSYWILLQSLPSIAPIQLPATLDFFEGERTKCLPGCRRAIWPSCS